MLAQDSCQLTEAKDMPQQLVLSDQTNARPRTHAFIIDWQDGVPLTPRTLISERVRMEWDKRAANAFADGQSSPLVQITPLRGAETAVSKSATSKLATLESVTAIALDGFARNAFFLVVDGRQMTDLDEEIPLQPKSRVTFVRLLPLQGG
jgi:hypothetical protein